MNPILQVENLKKVYSDGTVALNNINFEVHPGEFIVVIGPSGAGKSTLLRCINRLVEPTSGDVVFKGKKINKIGARQVKQVRREIGMVFQNFNLIDRLSVVNNVLHGRLGYTGTIKGALGLFSKKDIAEAEEILERVGLSKQKYKRADELSGGQMQRVGISRALAQRPRLILADEPIASLDPASSKIIMDHIFTICKEDKITAIVNLHQVDVAMKYATRIIGIKSGEVIFDGQPSHLTKNIIDEIYSNAKQPLVNAQ
ncbi:phosphonate transport system ATP-binding protein [Gracilibacillus ureilyticus]|uniref:Phosphonate transport system ATP-binding protein n=1 Tax=Gracilibacillus ureilyticus TaxID=531814 RepID=A0A1H9MQ46_9BACI|nr:phosphonate ABC transporter ATP-binding protein [Gracilibacillus ureilyticus]SER25830.1 phosphonate transport system ATP-binding protein [Gracilibacillus ureilyticus]